MGGIRTPRIAPKPRYPNAAEGQRIKAERLQAEAIILADPRPASVSLAHFVKRNLGADIAAGRCVVTYRLYPASKPQVVCDVQVDGTAYVIIPQGEGFKWRAFKTTLVVEWQPEE